jgi:hypothetical protein
MRDHGFPAPVLFAVASVVLGLLPSALGQVGQNTLPPEIAQLAARHKADVEASAKLQEQALAAARAPYLSALSAAEAKASTAGKPDELKAVMEESETVKTGRTMSETPSPLLPRTLMSARNAYLREIAKAARDHQARTQAAGGVYLRGLAFAESTARGPNRAALLGQINAEKLKLTGQSSAAPPVSSQGNVVLNGGFTAKEPDDTPSQWKHGGSGRGAVTSDATGSFLRMINTDGKEGFFLQLIGRPVDAKEVRVSVRLRSQAVKGGTYGLVVAQRNSGGGLIGRDTTCTTSSELHSWREFNATVKLKPDAAAFVLKCNMDGVIGTVEFSDVRAEVR